MSTNTKNNDDEEVDEVCASCGIKGVDDIKLIKCITCELVQYCSVACQKEHMPQHERVCTIHAAKLREELLFKQPESNHLGECQLCFLPLSLDSKKTAAYACCANRVCDDCRYENTLREGVESLEQKCQFCQTPIPETEEEANFLFMERVGANDPFALCQMGARHYSEQAAGLGSVQAHFNLACLYMCGQGVERDEIKELNHLEEAAIGGHPGARYNLGVHESNRGRMERAVKHFMIGANLGNDDSIEMLKTYYTNGLVEKEDLATALRAHIKAEELLFKQPKSSHLGECPICCLPLPIDLRKIKYQTCCSKVVCDGCAYAERLCEEEELQCRPCPFCRTPLPATQVDANQFCMKRIEANDPVAIRERGFQYNQEQNYTDAFEAFTKAAGLGDAEAHYQLARLYQFGHGVERDQKKRELHLEEAAIGGHPTARMVLGCLEGTRGRFERSVKHLIIAANLGCDDAIDNLKRGYMDGLVKKEDLAAALRAHKDAVDATKSPQREAGRQYFNRVLPR